MMLFASPVLPKGGDQVDELEPQAPCMLYRAARPSAAIAATMPNAWPRSALNRDGEGTMCLAHLSWINHSIAAQDEVMCTSR